MSYIWSEDMHAMHEKFGVHEVVEKMDKEKLRQFLKFRAECIQEETDELHHAISGKDVDAEEVVDALIDVCVFAIGTLDLFGVDANQAWNEVLEANMAKDVGIKKERPKSTKNRCWQLPKQNLENSCLLDCKIRKIWMNLMNFA